MDNFFEAFVVSPIQADADWTNRTSPLPRYDSDIDNYGAFSCLEVVVAGRQGERFVVPWTADLQCQLVKRADDGVIRKVLEVCPAE